MCGYVGNYTVLTKEEMITILNLERYAYLATMGLCEIGVVPMYYVISCENNNLFLYFIDMAYGETTKNILSNSVMTATVAQIVDAAGIGIFNSVVSKGKGTRMIQSCEQAYVMNLFKIKYGNYPGVLASFNNRDNIFIKMCVNQLTGRSYKNNG